LRATSEYLFEYSATPDRLRYPPAVASIAVIGAGAVGCYYGALLQRAGHDVRFLMRRDLAAVRARGLSVRSHAGDFDLAEVQAAGRPEELGEVDWVICALKATSLASAPALIAPALTPSTRIVALMNGYGIERELAGALRHEAVFGGMAFVCINRGDPGVIHHLRYGRVTIGHLADDPAETAALHALFAGAGIDTVVAPSLLHARWEKLCWNVPFNGLSVATGGLDTGAIVRDPALRAVAEAAMREAAAAGNADLAASGQAARLDPDEVVARLFALTETMGDYRTSMLIDYLAGAPLEVEAILERPLQRAHSLGVPVPTMRALAALVSAHDRRRRGLVDGPADNADARRPPSP
jgi:2-dehydropantoate 2-reductase